VLIQSCNLPHEPVYPLDHKAPSLLSLFRHESLISSLISFSQSILGVSSVRKHASLYILLTILMTNRRRPSMRSVLENFAPRLPNASFGFCALTTDTVRVVRRDVARRRLSRFAFPPSFSRNEWLTVLREGLLVPFVSHIAYSFWD
jgi:hypothetical protein